MKSESTIEGEELVQDSLKRCPFCGATPQIHSDTWGIIRDTPDNWFHDWVFCMNTTKDCDVTGPVKSAATPEKARELAISFWNRRYE